MRRNILRFLRKKKKELRAFEVLTVVSHKGISNKFPKRRMVISDKIPSMKDLGAGENEELLEIKYLSGHEVVIK